jgi:predicted metal-dependent phosphoesterase TrpH
VRAGALAAIAVACSTGPDPIRPTPSTPVDAAPVVATKWLKGSTHVHALPSGDSTTPIADVIRWYESHGYDFIALTDHNRVSEVDADTTGKVAVRAPATGLIVLAGAELTHNPARCLPMDPETKCRIHVNALGVTARPAGKIEWAERQSEQRIDQFGKALRIAAELGGIAQLNHPQWKWNMSADLLIELGRRGLGLIEVANVQFEEWNAGDATRPSVEALWDAALSAGLTMYGIATDDAHDYDDEHGEYPAGGGWVMVDSVRDPVAILAALKNGRFFASTGVELARVAVENDHLVIDVAPSSPGDHVIAFVANGAVVSTVTGRGARAPIPPAPGYVRAVVRRADGARPAVQPVRRSR